MKLRQLLKQFLADKQHSNSIFLTVAQGAITIFGYLFWVLVSRLYATSEVGTAASLISLLTLISQLSILGLNQGLVRFLPQSKDKNKMINSCLLPTIIAATIISTFGYILFAMHSIPTGGKLLFGGLFIIGAVFTTLNAFTDSIFLANRATSYNVIIYGAYGIVRTILPILFISSGAVGVFAANLAGVTIAVALSFYYMYRKFAYRFSLKVNASVLRSLGVYSVISYIAGILWIAPMLVAPSIVISKLGAKPAAYFYVANTIFNVLLILPTATSQSLYAEGSHSSRRDLKALTRKSLKFTFLIQIAAVAGMFAVGKLVIAAFGGSYATEASKLIYILAPSSLIVALNMTSNTVLKVGHEIWSLLTVNLIGAAVTVGTFFSLIQYVGIAGIGLGYLAGQLCMLALHIIARTKCYGQFAQNLKDLSRAVSGALPLHLSRPYMQSIQQESDITSGKTRQD